MLKRNIGFCSQFLMMAYFLFLSFSVFPQKFGYIDSKLILEKLEEYKSAQQALNQQAIQWSKELDGKKEELQKIRDKYYAKEILLSKYERKKKITELIEKEREVSDLERHIFGYQGLLFHKRLILIEPIQEKVRNAVKKIARKNRLNIVFDKSASLLMIYSNPEYNYTEVVLDLLLPEEKQQKNNEKE